MPKPSVHNPREAEVAANPEKYVATVFLGRGRFEKRDIPVVPLEEAWRIADAFGREMGRDVLLYAVRGDRQALMVRPG